MFKAELSNPVLLRTAFDAISNIIDEVKIKVDSEGMRLSSLDKSHITYVQLNLESELFDEYLCEEPETIEIDAFELMKVLKLAKKDDRLLLGLDDYNLIVILEGDSRSRFKIKLIEILDDDDRSPPELQFPVKLTVESSVIKDMLKKLSSFDSTDTANIKFEVDADYIYATSNKELVDVDIKFLHGERVTDTVGTSLRISKLENIMRAEKLSKYITMRIGNDMPVSLDFELINGRLNFLLAPVNGED